MDVSGDAGASGFADVHTQIDAVGMVEFAQDGFHALRERYHFAGGFRWQLSQFVEVRVGNDHHVAGCVGKRVQDDEAMLATIDDAHFRVVTSIHRITEDAPRCLLGG